MTLFELVGLPDELFPLSFSFGSVESLSFNIGGTMRSIHFKIRLLTQFILQYTIF